MAELTCYHYEGGPRYSDLLKARAREIADPVRKLIPCPGGCGGEALLEPPMTVTSGGVSRQVLPAVCRGGCTMDAPVRRRGRPKTVPRRFQLDPELVVIPEPEPRKDEEMDEKRQQEIQRLRCCLRYSGLTQQKLANELGISRSTINNFLCKGYATDENHAKLMEWCDEQVKPEPAPEPTPETAITPTPKPVAIPHDSPQEPLQRRVRAVETGNAFRAFLEPMLVELVRERLAAINEELAEQVEIRVLLEMPA